MADGKCSAHSRTDEIQYCVYRHFDLTGCLLYVGCAGKVLKRVNGHRNSSHWVRLVSRIEIEYFKSRQEALDAEREAILVERPLYNTEHNLEPFWHRRKPSAMSSELTRRQKEIFQFIVDYLENAGVPPSRGDICKHFMFNSPNAAEQHLRAIEAKGKILLKPGISRGIVVL